MLACTIPTWVLAAFSTINHCYPPGLVCTGPQLCCHCAVPIFSHESISLTACCSILSCLWCNCVSHGQMTSNQTIPHSSAVATSHPGSWNFNHQSSFSARVGLHASTKLLLHGTTLQPCIQLSNCLNAAYSCICCVIVLPSTIVEHQGLITGPPPCCHCAVVPITKHTTSVSLTAWTQHSLIVVVYLCYIWTIYMLAMHSEETKACHQQLHPILKVCH
jgi:hypothetical protein